MKFLQKILKEPLFHFFILGALIFALYSWVSQPGGPESNEILITQGKIQNLSEIFIRTWQRPPSTEELQGLIEDHIREEIFYREGVKMGLDQDDTMVRRRVEQKMDFLIEDDSNQMEPGETQLRKFLKENIGAFLVEPKYSFRQIYLNPDRRGDKLAEDAQVTLKKIREEPAREDWAGLGDPSLLDPQYQELRLSELQNIFGKEFAEQLKNLPINQWIGPISSSYGTHILSIVHRGDPREPAFEEVRESVEREWSYRQREERKKQFYQDLRKNYRVILEEPPSIPLADSNEGQK
jgi:hypothetical protein